MFFKLGSFGFILLMYKRYKIQNCVFKHGLASLSSYRLDGIRLQIRAS